MSHAAGVLQVSATHLSLVPKHAHTSYGTYNCEGARGINACGCNIARRGKIVFFLLHKITDLFVF